MSLTPAFELGLWNAWIFMAPALLVLLLCFPVMMKKDAPGGPSHVPCKSKITCTDFLEERPRSERAR